MYQPNKIRYKAVGSPMAVSALFGLYAVGKASILYPIEARVRLICSAQAKVRSAGVPPPHGGPSAPSTHKHVWVFFFGGMFNFQGFMWDFPGVLR